MLKKLVKSKKGSPTLEYVIIIAAGAAFAGLLLSVFATDGDENKGIVTEMRKKIENTVKKLNEEPKEN